MKFNILQLAGKCGLHNTCGIWCIALILSKSHCAVCDLLKLDDKDPKQLFEVSN